ncbi:MAG: hypothetical protein R6X11_07010 [Desulfonatronovibrio sp.]
MFAVKARQLPMINCRHPSLIIFIHPHHVHQFPEQVHALVREHDFKVMGGFVALDGIGTGYVLAFMKCRITVYINRGDQIFIFIPVKKNP